MMTKARAYVEVPGNPNVRHAKAYWGPTQVCNCSPLFWIIGSRRRFGFQQDAAGRLLPDL